MCLIIDPTITSLNKRTVWKVFDNDNPRGKILSLFRRYEYPLRKRIVREYIDQPFDDILEHGIHVYLSKRAARKEASKWCGGRIASLKVDPEDFLAADVDGETAAYHAATRIGKFIRIPLRGSGLGAL